ncbi:MAG: hydroxymethylbilane synthase [Syntrophomonadaceae bacterium]|nr:hydroxymethylbilane synthase [Syntrophomonadaceae bacterium]
MTHIRLGTRGSKLARWQTEHVADRLKSFFPRLDIEIVVIKTTGDIILDVALSRIGDKGLFTKELETALLNNEIDVAVHSAKDLPSELDENLKIGAVLPRENPHDVLLSHKRYRLADLPPGALIGTSSLRRIAQMKAYRPDLVMVDIRGNVETRIRKMQEQNLDAIILANAGVQRLGLTEYITEYLPYDVMLPAVGQGIIAIECRREDSDTTDILQKINDPLTSIIIQAERAFLRKLEGGCQVPIACLAEEQEGQLCLNGLVASLDGSTVFRESMYLDQNDPENGGRKAADLLLQQGAGQVLEQIKNSGD